MDKKYIVTLADEYALVHKLTVPVTVNGKHTAWIQTDINLTPYTEPDMEQVRKEAYEKGKMDAYVEDSKNITVLKEEAEEAYEDGYKTAKVQCNIQAEKDLREVGERHYQKGLSDAWDAARKIVDLWRDIPNDELLKIFDVCGNWGESVLSLIMRCLPPSEAIEKIRQYEQEKEEQIQVGDEVIATSGKAVIVGINADKDKARYIYPDSTLGFDNICNLSKTGRHFPEIAEVLQKMKES